MDFFDYWCACRIKGTFRHPNDNIVLEELKLLIDGDFEYELPPGPYFGPLKTASIVLCYANPSVDEGSSTVIASKKLQEILFKQLDGDQPYPYNIPGWDKWFRPVAKYLYAGDIEAAAKNIAVFNLIPYASVNMDKVQFIANSIPSVWAAQSYLRDVLIPKAKNGKILLIMCRSSQYWGLRSSHGSENIILNNVRSGFTEETKAKVNDWRKKNGLL
jgi:hypothetical protein